MLFSTVGQGRLFIWMTGAGLVIGAWYALTGGLRRLIRAGFWLSLVCDIIFGLGAAVIFLLFLFRGNGGVCRPFCVLAAMTGFALFIGALCPVPKAIGKRTGRILCRMFCKIRQNRWIKVIFK